MTCEDEKMNILKKIAMDLFILTLLGLSAYAMNYTWVPFERGFFCDDESLMYPYSDDTVTVQLMRIVGLCLPILAFLICEWHILRKETDVHRCFGISIPRWIHGFYCVLASFAVGCCFNEIAINMSKAVIGRPRPHFFAICQPSVNCSLTEWRGKYVLPSDYTCTGPHPDKFLDARRSFISGHSAFSAFTMFYLAMYIENRMQFSVSHSFRHTVAFVAVMLSWFVALSRVSDYKHHWSDVLAGYTVGILFAIVVWTWGTELIQKRKKINEQENKQETPAETQVTALNGNS